MAVTKTVDAERINEAISFGISNIGENKVQEILDKYEKITPKVKWHMIGHLQSNKVKYIIDKVHLIHSLDRISLAKEIQKRAEEHDIYVDALVQVNVAEEDSKFGLKKEEVIPFINDIKSFDRIRVKGLMTIAPYAENPEDVRFVFRDLKCLFEQIKQLSPANTDMKYLSMGMTNDFEVALEEGSNIIRIGTGILEKEYKEEYQMADIANKFLSKVKYIIGLDDMEEPENEIVETNNEVELDLQKNVYRQNKVLNIHTNNNVKLVVYEPTKYEEAPKMVEDLKNRKIVVINLEEMETEPKKQIFDFLNGSIYALDGNIQKVSKDIFILAPSNVEIDSRLKEELKNKGIFPWQK